MDLTACFVRWIETLHHIGLPLPKTNRRCLPKNRHWDLVPGFFSHCEWSLPRFAAAIGHSTCQNKHAGKTGLSKSLCGRIPCLFLMDRPGQPWKMWRHLNIGYSAAPWPEHIRHRWQRSFLMPAARPHRPESQGWCHNGGSASPLHTPLIRPRFFHVMQLQLSSGWFRNHRLLLPQYFEWCHP